MKIRWGILACLAAALSGPAGAATFALPPSGEDLIGEPSYVEAQMGDTLATLAFQYGLGFRALLHANPGLDPWNLRTHQHVELPTWMLLPSVREGIVVNIPEMRLYYFTPDRTQVLVYPVAVGRVDWRTPLGETLITRKVRNPAWYVPVSIQREHAEQGDPLPEVVAAGDPENPLGSLALRLGWPDVLIHGTNKPLGGIGMPVTHGCVRLYEPDITDLFKRVTIGTKVTMIDEPYKLGRHNGHWLLEAHAPVTEDAHAATIDVTPTLVKMRATAPVNKDATLDWNRVAAVLRRADGLPTPLEPPRAAPSPPPVESPEVAMAEADDGAPTVRAEPRGLLALGALVILGLGAGVWRRRRGFGRRDIGA